MSQENISQELFQVLHRICKQAMQQSVPSDYIYGKVTNIQPLEVTLESREVIPEEFLTLTDAVRDYEVDISVSHLTENRSGGGGYSEFASHNHAYSGRKQITVHNALSIGEEVVLLQQQGGQDFLILNRRFNSRKLTGQWI